MWNPFRKNVKPEKPEPAPAPKKNGGHLPDFDGREDTARITLKLEEYREQRKECTDKIEEVTEKVEVEAEDFGKTMRSLPAFELPEDVDPKTSTG